MTNTQTAGLQNLILVAMDDISILLGTPPDEMESSQVIEMCNAHLENISMAAELAERPGLQLLIELYQQNLQKLDVSDLFLMQVMEWLSFLSTYLQDADDKQNSVVLLDSFNEEQSQLLAEMLQLDQNNLQDSELAEPVSELIEQADIEQELFNEVDDDDDDDDDEDNDEYDISQLRTTDVLNMFLEEFIDVSSRMDTLISGLTAENCAQDESIKALLQYQEIIDRIILTSDSLQLVGLGKVCAFVKHNIVMLGGLDSLDQEHFEETKALLAGWTVPVINYLQSPNDDDTCMQLVGYLEDELWPEPLVYKDAQGLLILLTDGIGEIDAAGNESHREHVASDLDVSLEIAGDVSEALLDAFFHEAPALAVEFSAHIERLASGEHVLINLESAQRLAHTLKGSANLIGARGVANLTHHIEDILEYLTRNQTTPPAQLAETLQESADTVEAMIEAMQGQCEQPENALIVLQSILDWANKIDQGSIESDIETTTVDTEASDTTEEFSLLNINSAKPVIPVASAQAPVAKTEPVVGRNEVLHIPIGQVDEMFRLVGEMSIAMGQMQERIKGLINEGEHFTNQDIVVQQRRFELENVVDVKNVASRQRRLRVIGGSQARFDPLEMDEYDDVQGAVHSFIESVADSRSISQQLNLQGHQIDSLLAQQNQLYSELQQIIMRTRMVPVETIAARLQRSVRQACRATGKKAKLEIIGLDLHIDGEVLGKLAAPLMHMLRNAIDHGIEAPEERRLLGKHDHGQVTLSFLQTGNQFVVQCTDDGRGLDYERIRHTAEDRGLIVSGQTMSDNEVARLILNPGFTTRESATQVSGRGVGMDVVNTTITGLKGVLEIADSETTSGSQFTLRLPITLVTSHSVLVEVENELFAIPTNTLVQILTPGIGEFGSLGSKDTYQLNKDIYQAKHLNQLLNISSNETADDSSNKYTLLVRSDTGIIAITVNNVVNSYDLVVKNMGRYVKSVNGVSGISVLGDGSVIPVLDLPELLRAPTHTTRATPIDSLSKQTSTKNNPRVLIVDDSLSVRQSLSQLIEDSGFDVMLARDGLEAMDIIREQLPDIVLADMEMPRMNGLELTSAIRSNPQTKTLPVIMITSRSMQKHREEAEKAGVNIYMNKPFAEDVLLTNIQTMLSNHE